MMPTLVCNYGRFQDELNPAIGASLVLTDPPYNLGFDYGDVSDNQDDDAYWRMIDQFLHQAHAASADDAHLMVIHYPEHFFDLAEVYRASPWKRHQILTWTYNGHTANGTTTKLRRATRQILWMTKGNPKTFPERILRPYRNPNDNRIKARMAAGHEGARPTDHFHVEQVKAGSEEHRGYSNQIPEALLRQLVLLTTEPGQVVADPFAGTGSTLRAALNVGRKAWGCDANPEAPCHREAYGGRQVVLASATEAGGDS